MAPGLPMSCPASRVHPVVKVDVHLVGRLLARGRYIDGMPTFTLAGVSYEYLGPTIAGDPEGVRSWEYGNYPKVEAAVPLEAGGTVQIYGEASRWGHGYVIVAWLDDEWHPHWAWIPVGNVRRLTDSDWDIIQYHRCPPERRQIRWGDRLPGFLPE